MIAEANDTIGMLREQALQYARGRSWNSLPLSGRSHARHSRSADAVAAVISGVNSSVGMMRAQALQYSRSRRWSCAPLSGSKNARHSRSVDVFAAVNAESPKHR